MASYPLPWCSTLCEGALKRRFHLQDVHCAEFSKETKRDRHDAAIGDSGPSVTCRGKRRCMHQGSPDSENALLPTTEYHFIDETVETIKSRPLNPATHGKTAMQRNNQGLASQRGFTILDPGSLSTPTTCPPVTRKIDYRLRPPPTSVLNSLMTPWILVHCRRTIRPFSFSLPIMTTPTRPKVTTKMGTSHPAYICC